MWKLSLENLLETKINDMAVEPIVKEDLTFIIPLHMFLWNWDFIIKLIGRLGVPITLLQLGEIQIPQIIIHEQTHKEKQFIIDTVICLNCNIP